MPLTDDVSQKLKMSVVVDDNFRAHGCVLGRRLDDNNVFWKTQSAVFNSCESMESLLSSLAASSICSGINDDKCLSVLRDKAIGYVNLLNVLHSQKYTVLELRSAQCDHCNLLKRRLYMRYVRQRRSINATDLTKVKKSNKLLSSPLRLAKLAPLARRTHNLNKEVVNVHVRLK